jgi:hypothetical protein
MEIKVKKRQGGSIKVAGARERTPIRQSLKRKPHHARNKPRLDKRGLNQKRNTANRI